MNIDEINEDRKGGADLAAAQALEPYGPTWAHIDPYITGLSELLAMTMTVMTMMAIIIFGTAVTSSLTQSLPQGLGSESGILGETASLTQSHLKG